MKKMLYYFLPKNYPSSVEPDYIKFYSWMFLVSFFGSATYVISTTALLESVNIVSNAAGVAAGINWVLKDGLGTLGKIASTNILAKKFDADSKRAMWRAEILHNIGVALELLTAVFPMMFLFMASLANICKGVAGITTGACKASINKHFARNENYNLGDITAKSTTQGLAGFTLGMSFGITCYQLLSTSSPIALWGLFIVMGSCHIFCSYKALRNIQFRTLNQQRFAILEEQYLIYLEQKKANGIDRPLALDTPESIQMDGKECIVLTPSFLKYPRIVLGSDISSSFSTQGELVTAFSIFEAELFMLNFNKNKIHVLLKQQGSDYKDLLKAFFAAYYLQSVIRKATARPFSKEMLVDCLQFTQCHFDAFLEALKNKGWDLSTIALELGDYRYLKLH